MLNTQQQNVTTRCMKKFYSNKLAIEDSNHWYHQTGNW